MFSVPVKDLRTLCYSLYQLDWKKRHNITPEVEEKAIKSYLEEYEPKDFTNAEPPAQTFQEYLDEVGYDGEYFVCFEEFLECEYQDHDYIMELLSGMDIKHVIEYEKDIDYSEIEK